MIPGFYTGNGIPLDKRNIRGIAHVRTNRKEDIFMQRRLYIDKAHMALAIFRFAVFFLHICVVIVHDVPENLTHFVFRLLLIVTL